MTIPFYTPPEVLDAHALTVEQVAHACRMEPQWVLERVSTGILHYDPSEGADTVHPDGTAADPATATATAPHAPASWRFSTHTVIRARRIADLERTFDADPQLAALTADLIEEVRQLRRLLHK